MPDYWQMNHEYCEKWDAELRQLMKEHDFKQLTENYGKIKHICSYQVKLGDRKIWVENHPYASFCDRSHTELGKKKRPSRQTIYLAKKKLEEDKKKIDWNDDTQLRRERVKHRAFP
jgi:hypothetical protein